MRSIGLRSTSEIVLQPFGAFLVDRTLNRFDVLNSTGAGLLLGLYKPRQLDEYVQWASTRGQGCEAIDQLISGLDALGYLIDDADSQRPTVSFLEHADVLKATRSEFELTNRCNLHCDYCYAEVNTSRDELTADQWIEVLEGMHQHGLRAALFSGGEPMLHRGIFPILEWASARLVTEMNSNGTYITADAARRLSTLNIKQVQISLDSATPEYHDSVRGRGSHAKAMFGIRNLINADVPVQLSAVITKRNRHLMDDLCELADDLGVVVKGDPVTRTGYARQIPDSRWVDDFSATSSDRISSATESESLGFVPICQSQVGFVAVSHQGILKPCNMREHFFQPTAGLLTHQRGEQWWNDFYGRTRLADLAGSAGNVPADRADDLRANTSGYLCELQLSVAATMPTSLTTTRRSLPLTPVHR